MATKFYVYGYMGFEQEIDWHIKTRAIFVVGDEKQKVLAWYTFSQDLAVKLWQTAFDLASLGDRKLQRSEMFGSALPMGIAFLQDDPATFDIRKLATPVPGVGSPATLSIRDDASQGTTNCIIFIDSVKPNGFIAMFDLKTEAPRKEMELFDVVNGRKVAKPKHGRVFRLGVEPFTTQALDRGPTKALIPNFDPYDPML
jgi:hypothetical protein